MTLPDKFEKLIRVFEARRFEFQSDPIHAIGALPPVEAMPSPWEVWIVISLVRYREKQLRAAEIVASFMGPEWHWRCGKASVDESAYEEFCNSQSEWELRILWKGPVPGPRRNRRLDARRRRLWSRSDQGDRVRSPNWRRGGCRGGRRTAE